MCLCLLGGWCWKGLKQQDYRFPGGCLRTKTWHNGWCYYWANDGQSTWYVAICPFHLPFLLLCCHVAENPSRKSCHGVLKFHCWSVLSQQSIAILVALQNDTSTRHSPGLIAGWTAKWRNFRATPGLDCRWWDYDYTYPGITVKILICWAQNPIFHRLSPVNSHEKIPWHVHKKYHETPINFPSTPNLVQLVPWIFNSGAGQSDPATAAGPAAVESSEAESAAECSGALADGAVWWMVTNG